MTNTDSTPASNSDVLAKYGRAPIMVRAWRSFKTAAMFNAPISFGEALRQAWAGFRVAIDRIAADNAKRAARKSAHGSRGGLLGRIANNPTATKDAWGRNSSRYLNTVMGR